MEKICDYNWFNTSVDARVTEEDCWLIGLVVTNDGTNAAGDVTLYEGVNTNGRKIGKFTAERYVSRPIFFPLPGLRCSRGIYIDVGSNVDNVLIVWRGV